MNEETFVINIGRQLGSGGKEIGLRLADMFGIKCYDNELIKRAAKESGIDAGNFETSDEKKQGTRSFFSNFIPFVGSGDIYGNPISEETLFRIQSETIRQISDEHSCIFIGRCADYVLRNKKRCANIFISANLEDRIKRLCSRRIINAQAAEKLVRQGDQQRSQYYNFYSDGTWGSADTYHLCINSSIFGIEGTTEFIADFIEKKLHIKRLAK
jgi:cytidylate kinase